MSVIKYLIIIFLCYLMSLFVSDQRKRRSYFLITLIAIGIGLFSVWLGYKPYMYDRGSYILHFNVTYPVYLSDLSHIFRQPVEIGFVIVNVIVRYFTSNYLWLFFVFAFIPTVITLFVLYKFPYKFKSLFFLYIISMIPLFTTYLNRQMFAVAVFNIAIYYYYKGNKTLYLIYTLLACFFHGTAVIGFLLFVFLQYAKNLRRDWYIVISMLVAVVALFPLVEFLISNIAYLNEKFDISELSKASNIVFLKGLPFLMIGFIALYNRNYLIKYESKIDMFIVLTIFTGICWVYAIKGYWLYRISIFSMVPALILAQILFSKLKDKKLVQLIYVAFVTSMAIITIREIYLLYWS
ncbi:hypothetical protein A6P54_13405 [Bacillus sp. MKU004]|nr:hypothetical protein A6P54_13405 [Bacillus sp. MKU004]